MEIIRTNNLGPKIKIFPLSLKYYHIRNVYQLNSGDYFTMYIYIYQNIKLYTLNIYIIPIGQLYFNKVEKIVSRGI